MAAGMIRSTGGGGGGLAGARPRGYNTASGGIPGVTSPIDTVTSNLGGLSNIINSITSTQSGALKDQYPDEYFNVLGTLLGNTQRRAAGDISDLLPELQQNSAEDAVYGGMSGSGAENTKLLRDLGLTRYGVQNNAIDALTKIQGQIPTVGPFNPNAIIGSQLDAQERADIYAAAPVPEDAYQRAMSAAGGGGGGGATPGKTYGGAVGGPAGPGYTPINRSQPNMAPQYGTAMNPMGGNPSAAAYDPWAGGSFNSGAGSLPPGFWKDPAAAIISDDFGGSLGYGGGQAWDPLSDILGYDMNAGQSYGYDPLGTNGGAYNMVSSGTDYYDPNWDYNQDTFDPNWDM